MTDQELKVIDTLVQAHNLFVALPVQHPDDSHEWRTKLHDLQRIIMAREAVRNNPSYFIDFSQPSKYHS